MSTRRSHGHFVMTPIGSGGDVWPYIRLGRELVSREHRVTLLASEPFAQGALQAGLSFVSTWSTEDYEREALHPDLWHPQRGFRRMMRLLGEQLESLWAHLETVADGPAILVGHTLSFATRAYAEARDLPHTTIHLAPSVFRSRHEQAVMPGPLDMNRWPRPVVRAFWWLADRLMIDPAIAPDLNRFRSAHGLPPIRRVFDRAIHSPHVTALFPDWFASPQPDWPPNTHLTGFPLERNAGDTLPDDLEQWLSERRAPIVFTAGTANFQAARFFESAARAAVAIDRPALLLTAWPEQVPSPLPPDVRHLTFAPFETLLPRCAAIVHHGGIGTCAEGLAAGIPQLVMPMAFDQPDNAARLIRLGVARQLAPERFTAERLAPLLSQLVEDPKVAEACDRFRARILENDGVAIAADELETLAEISRA